MKLHSSDLNIVVPFRTTSAAPPRSLMFVYPFSAHKKGGELKSTRLKLSAPPWSSLLGPEVLCSGLKYSALWWISWLWTRLAIYRCHWGSESRRGPYHKWSILPVWGVVFLTLLIGVWNPIILLLAGCVQPVTAKRKTCHYGVKLKHLGVHVIFEIQNYSYTRITVCNFLI